MSHGARRICSRSCHAVWGAPFGVTPRSLAGKSLNTLSKATCALPLFNKATTCSRTGSFMVFQPPKRYKDQKFISLCFFLCSLAAVYDGGLLPFWIAGAHSALLQLCFFNRICGLLSVGFNFHEFEGAKEKMAPLGLTAH